MLIGSQKRRRFHLALALSACSALALGLMGCPPPANQSGISGSPSGPSTTLIVGFVGPLTGDAASFGISQKNGIEMARDEINAAGGVGGSPVTVVYEDTQLDQNKAITAFNKVTDSDKATVVLGETSSANTKAIGPLAQRKGVLLLSPIASSANLTTSGFPLFRISPSDAFQARIAAQYALSRGWKTTAILYTNDEWGTGLKDAFATDFKAGGGQVLGDTGVEPKAQDIRPSLTKIKSLKPAFIYIPMHPDEAGVAIKQAKQLGIASSFLGADSFSEPTIAKIAGSATDGVVYTMPASGFGAAYDQFAKQYQAKFNGAPNYNAAAGYDALKVIAAAAKRAGKTDATALATALKQTKNYEGASGSITFDTNGDVTSKAFDLKKLQNGQSTLVQGHIAINK